ASGREAEGEYDRPAHEVVDCNHVQRRRRRAGRHESDPPRAHVEVKGAQAAAVVSPHQVMEVDARARLCQWPAKTVKELRAVVATLRAGRRKAETRTVRRREQES